MLNQIEESGVIAVIRLSNVDKLEHISEALQAGGVTLLEITLTTPNAIHIIEELSNKVQGNLFIGAGSILDAETARTAILAGARFIVSPIMKVDVIHMAHRYGIVCIAGGFSPTEIITAWENGADIVKVFPATALGPQFFKDLHAPLPQIKLMPTGGVNLENAAEFIKSGACCIGAGTTLLDKRMIVESDWDGLTTRARQFVEAVKRGRADQKTV